jgi:flagellar motor protein MotB
MLMAFALNLKNQQTVFEITTDQLTRANETRAQMLRDIQTSLMARGVDVKIDEQNGVLRLPESLLFERGEFKLQDAGRRALQHLADVLTVVLPCYAHLPSAAVTTHCPPSKGGRLEAVFIEGNTDDRPINGRLPSGITDNWELSAYRAIEVYKELVRASPVLATIENDPPANTSANRQPEGQKLFGVSGYAQFRPVDPGDSEAARAANRRIDLRFLMETPNQQEVEQFRSDVSRGRAR